MNRRHFLKAAGASAMGAALFNPLRAFAQSAQKRNLVVVFVRGGWDIQVSLDPKLQSNTLVDNPPGALDTDIADFGSGGGQMLIRQSSPGITQFFNDWGDKTALVNGIDTRSIAHFACYRHMLTGLTQEGHADLATLIANDNNENHPVPGFVLGATNFTGPFPELMAQTGVANQITGLANPSGAGGYLLCTHSTLVDACFFGPDGIPRTAAFVPDDNLDQLIAARTQAQAQRFRARPENATGKNARLTRDFDLSLSRSSQLSELDFGGASFALTLDQRFVIARKLLDPSGEGPTSRSVLLGSTKYFDSHANCYAPNGQIDMQDELFSELNTFLTDLHNPALSPGQTAPSLGEETVVVVMSEMSRTPKLNASAGKDHWPVTSALVIGPGVRGGQTVGHTDLGVNAERVDLDTGALDENGDVIAPKFFARAVLEICGADAERHLQGVRSLNAIKA